MSDQHRLRTPMSTEEVEHLKLMSDDFARMLMSEDSSDVVFIVEKARFHAHKIVMAARSEYFRAMLFGGMKESISGCNEIELKDTTASGFTHLLKYIYTGRLNLANLKEDTLLDILALAHIYGFVHLEAAISDHLKAVLDIRNVCIIYDLALLYSLESLAQTCCLFMDRFAHEVMQTDSFMNLSSTSLAEIVSRDSFCALEIDIFRGVQLWYENNPGQNVSEVVRHIRLPLIIMDDLLNIVRQSELFPAEAILDAICIKTKCRDIELNYRGVMIPDENVATPRLGAQVLCGEMKAALLDGDSQNYDLDRGFTRHPIDENNGQGITIKLEKPYMISTINLLLWDKDLRAYSYYIEVSMDSKDWIRIIDHTKYLCRTRQALHFDRRVVKYVRVVGTHNTVNRVFHLVHFECLYSQKTFEVMDGITVPKHNVATIPLGAHVIEGVSRCRNALINGDVKNYDWDSGYTCHQLGSGAIVVQLAQPYMIDSLRMKLWDCDSRSYSYYVEVSTDQQKWTLVCDKTKEACKAWQTIVFKPRPVCFIKIVGTHNTANEVFHCVHFECPADPADVADVKKAEAERMKLAAKIEPEPME